MLPSPLLPLGISRPGAMSNTTPLPSASAPRVRTPPQRVPPPKGITHMPERPKKARGQSFLRRCIWRDEGGAAGSAAAAACFTAQSPCSTVGRSAVAETEAPSSFRPWVLFVGRSGRLLGVRSASIADLHSQQGRPEGARDEGQPDGGERGRKKEEKGAGGEGRSSGPLTNRPRGLKLPEHSDGTPTQTIVLRRCLTG